MRPIRNRDDILALAEKYAPTNACATAIRTGNAKVVGGFEPPDGPPMFVVEVKSERGKVWLIAVEVNEAERKHTVKQIDAVPWAHYNKQVL